jgi:DNA polymerase II small subunit/DNA polymerase delta subunit B
MSPNAQQIIDPQTLQLVKKGSKRYIEIIENALIKMRKPRKQPTRKNTKLPVKKAAKKPIQEKPKKVIRRLQPTVDKKPVKTPRKSAGKTPAKPSTKNVDKKPAKSPRKSAGKKMSTGDYLKMFTKQMARLKPQPVEKKNYIVRGIGKSD